MSSVQHHRTVYSAAAEAAHVASAATCASASPLWHVPGWAKNVQPRLDLGRVQRLACISNVYLCPRTAGEVRVTASECVKRVSPVTVSPVRQPIASSTSRSSTARGIAVHAAHTWHVTFTEAQHATSAWCGRPCSDGRVCPTSRGMQWLRGYQPCIALSRRAASRATPLPCSCFPPGRHQRPQLPGYCSRPLSRQPGT